ncbi:hypothetical protein D3C87_1465840 [compost metagenome]
MVLHVHPGLEVQRLDAPGLADVGVPLVSGGTDAQCAARAQVNHVGELLIQFHAGGNGDHPTVAVIGAHAHFGDNVACLRAGLVLVLDLHQGLLAFISVNLADDDLAGTGYLVDGQRGTQGVVGVRVEPVAQGSVAIGFAQFSARIFCVFSARTRHRRPEKKCAGIGVEVLILEAVHQFWSVDGVRRIADGNTQVPGCEIDHSQKASTIFLLHARARCSSTRLGGRSL